MKVKIVLIMVLLIVMLFSFITYLGTFISEKYDTQLEGLNPTTEQIKYAKQLKKKIDSDKKITLSIIIVSLITIYPVSLIKKIIYFEKEKNYQSTLLSGGCGNRGRCTFR